MNYHTYFTEVEEHFRRARNSGMFMMSPLDWALVEVWKDGGVPLQAVLKGIDRAFRKYHGRRRLSTVNSVAYCAQEVMEAAREAARARAYPAQRAGPSLDPSRLDEFLRERAGQLRQLVADGTPAGGVFGDVATSLEAMAEQSASEELEDLEEVEQRLTALEDRVFGAATSAMSEDRLLAIRREMDASLKAYRRKLSAEQLAMLEQRYVRRSVLAELGLSRLSLFYVD